MLYRSPVSLKNISAMLEISVSDSYWKTKTGKKRDKE
jgi:hypothetical protein